ncbi:hypothetical protein [Planctomicrobium sp. SH664]|uniref:hypothetical protein n=1 Tax=Planctomicrobium sp. SH664 TaxID=3448125 RepID=UPI003F5B1559
MTRLRTIAFGSLMLGVGYLCGSDRLTFETHAADDRKVDVSEENAKKIRAAYQKLEDAMEGLRGAGRYEAITKGANSFLILSGGGNAKEDLESGRGVDPETFAALYAGQALPEIKELLTTDDQGRILYNNEVVRIYSKSRLDRLYADRVKLTEIGF